jgi:hypothetical protein
MMAYGPPPPLPRPSFPDEHRRQITDALSQAEGRHTLKFGVDTNLVHEILINLFQGEGVYSYSGSPTVAFGNWVADVYGVNLGDRLTGRYYTSFTQAYDPITKVGKDDFWDQDYWLCRGHVARAAQPDVEPGNPLRNPERAVIAPSKHHNSVAGFG